MEEVLVKLEHRRKLSNAFLSELLEVDSRMSYDFCSKLIRLSLVYPYHSNSLENIMSKRKK